MFIEIGVIMMTELFHPRLTAYYTSLLWAKKKKKVSDQKNCFAEKN